MQLTGCMLQIHRPFYCCLNFAFDPFFMSRDGAVLRALVSHQCGAGLISGLGVICGLSLLLDLVLALRRLSPGSPIFSSKTNVSKFQFGVESDGHRFVSRNRLKCRPCFNINLNKVY